MTRAYTYPDKSKQEKRILRLVDKWVPLMDLEHIEVVNVFNDQAHGEEGGDGGTIEMTAAITAPSWEYRVATITWYLPMIAAIDDERLEETVVHELCHVLLGPLKDALKANTIKVEELATENVARAVLKAHRG